MPGQVAKLINERAGRATSTELARRFGVSQPTFSKWRAGRGWPGPENQRAMAEWLRISPVELRRLIAQDKAAKLTQEADTTLDERLERMDDAIAQVRSELKKLAERVRRPRSR
jgi:transcriptional regulator with XRE-family HTH domain